MTRLTILRLISAVTGLILLAGGGILASVVYGAGSGAGESLPAGCFLSLPAQVRLGEDVTVEYEPNALIDAVFDREVTEAVRSWKSFSAWNNEFSRFSGYNKSGCFTLKLWLYGDGGKNCLVTLVDDAYSGVYTIRRYACEGEDTSRTDAAIDAFCPAIPSAREEEQAK